MSVILTAPEEHSEREPKWSIEGSNEGAPSQQVCSSGATSGAARFQESPNEQSSEYEKMILSHVV